MTRTDDSLPASAQRIALTHDQWMSIAEVEYQRLLDLFVEIADDQWLCPTDCDEWNVRQVLAHLVGGAASTASLWELWRLQRLGRAFRPGVDGMNDVEVSERADTSPARLQLDLADSAKRGLRTRRRIPAAIRWLRVPFGPPLGVRSIGYLIDRIYTRDAWMHRIDISRATSRSLLLTPEHDGSIVDDIVREWAHDHRRPYDLTLTGVAGGHWSTATAAEPLTLDAVEFSRIMAGRATGEGLLARQIPF